MRCTFFYIYHSFLIFTWFTLIHSHGFGPNVYIKSTHGWYEAGLVQPQQLVSSFDEQARITIKSKIVARGSAVSNCYVAIQLQDAHETIDCTPSQLFFLADNDAWVSACELRSGDHLLSHNGNWILVDNVSFVNCPLKVFSFEIKDTHTYFVGSKSVLTHTMFVPFSFVGLSVAFGSGAATGGTAGTFFGPVSLVGGVVIGGLLGCVFYTCKSHNIFTYTVYYDQEAIVDCLIKNQNKNNTQNNEELNLQGTPAPKRPDEDKNKKMNNKEAEEAAKELGFEKTNYYSQGQPVFKNGNRFITPDQTAHNGGVWKMADSVKNLASKRTRMGTYDKLLKRIGN